MKICIWSLLFLLKITLKGKRVVCERLVVWLARLNLFNHCMHSCQLGFFFFSTQLAVLFLIAYKYAQIRIPSCIVWVGSTTGYGNEKKWMLYSMFYLYSPDVHLSVTAITLLFTLQCYNFKRALRLHFKHW